jgi:hypothetical protein
VLALLEFLNVSREAFVQAQTTSAIERVSSRRPRPVEAFINTQSVDWIVDAILNRFNRAREKRTSAWLHRRLGLAREAS